MLVEGTCCVLVIMVIITLHLMTMITILPPRCWERVGLVTMMALLATLSKETGVMSLPIVVSWQLLSFFAILLFSIEIKSDKRMNKSLLPFQLKNRSTLFHDHKGHVLKNSFQVLFRLCQRQDILSKEGGRTGLKYFSIVSLLTIIITIIIIGVVINIM